MSAFQIDVSFPTFTAEFKKARKKFPTFVNDVKETLETVQANPGIGNQIPRRHNLFKIRVGVKGQMGQRGGYRLIYHVDWKNEIITPIALYFKPDTPVLPDAELTRRFSELMKHFKSQEPEPPPRPIE